jgi:hypothetical protein
MLAIATWTSKFVTSVLVQILIASVAILLVASSRA